MAIDSHRGTCRRLSSGCNRDRFRHEQEVAAWQYMELRSPDLPYAACTAFRS